MEFDLKFYISLTPTTQFDGERYVVGQNGKLLRLKPGRGDDFRPQGNSVRHMNFWADDIFQNRCQSAVYNVVVKGLIENVLYILTGLTPLLYIISLHSGRDGVVLACGPHYSGKTFGIIGIGHQNEGIAPRLLKDIFTRRNNKASSAYKMSCVEFKESRVFDLLSRSEDPSSTIKGVSMQNIESYNEAKRLLNLAHLKRTIVDDNGVSVHIGSFVITIYSSVLLKDKSKLGKIHIIDMAGVGTAHVPTAINHQSQANKAMLEFSMFLDHIKFVDFKRRHCFKKPYRHATLPLLKYCYRSFSKQYTVLRLICYVRPEAKWMLSNLTTLKLGEAIRKVPTTETKLCLSHPDDPVDLLQQMTHLQCELLVMEHLKGSTFMGNMSIDEFEVLKNMARDILYSDNEIKMRRLNYAEATVLLSVFKEEYQKQAELKKALHKDMEEIELISNAAEPFHTKSFTLIEPNFVKKMTGDMRKSMTDVLTPHSVMALDIQKLWVNFSKESQSSLKEQKQVADHIDTAYQTLVTAINKTLSVQDDFTKMRSYMSEIQKNRHSKKDESYDSDMNILVPDEEKFLYRKICKVELELMEAHKNLKLTKKRLKEILAKYAKIKNEIKKRFEEYVNIQKRKERNAKMKGSMSVRMGKSIRNLAAAKSVVIRKPSRE